jgi:hypothetical protein
MCVPCTSTHTHTHTLPSLAHWTPYIYIYTYCSFAHIPLDMYITLIFNEFFWTTKFNVFKLFFYFICFHTTLISISLFLQTVLIFQWLFQFTLFQLHNQGLFYGNFNFNFCDVENLAIVFHFVTLGKNNSKIFPNLVVDKICPERKKNQCDTQHSSQWILFLQTTHTLQCFAFLLGAQYTIHS